MFNVEISWWFYCVLLLLACVGTFQIGGWMGEWLWRFLR